MTEPSTQEAPSLVVPSEAPRKSVVTAYLAWLLLGWLGVHRFYLGHWFSGLLYALTLGGFFVGWAVDFVLIPFLVRGANGRIARAFAEDPSAFASAPQRIAPWAEERACVTTLQLPLFLLVWLIGPMLLIGIGVLWRDPRPIVLVLLVLGVTAALTLSRGLIEAAPTLLKTPVAGAALTGLRSLEEFYFEHPPRPLPYYVLYPILGPAAWWASPVARQEAKLLLKAAALIAAALVTQTLVSYPTVFPPHLGLEEAFVFLVVSLGILLVLMVCLLLPMVTSSMTLNLSGRSGQARLLVAVALFASTGLGTAFYVYFKEGLSLPDALTVQMRMEKTSFREELAEVSEMFLVHHAARLEGEGPTPPARDEDLTGKLRRALGSVTPRDERLAFSIWRARGDTTGDWLALVYSNNGEDDDGGPDHVLFLASPSLGFHRSSATMLAAGRVVLQSFGPSGSTGLEVGTPDAMFDEHAKRWSEDEEDD